jgi:hypothetical protein
MSSPDVGTPTLAERTLNEVASVRTRLGRAVESAEALDRELWNLEKAYLDRPDLPREEPAEERTDFRRRSVLADATRYAGKVSSSARRSLARLDEFRDELAGAANALTRAKGLLDELEDPPAGSERQPGATAAGQSVSTEDLRNRLTRLESAIETAHVGVDRTEERLTAAQRNTRGMVKIDGELDTRKVPDVYEAAEAVTKNLPGLQAGVGTASSAHTQAQRATEAADDLAAAMRAAANPTPQSDQQAPASASETDHRDRTGNGSRNQQLNR